MFCAAHGFLAVWVGYQLEGDNTHDQRRRERCERISGHPPPKQDDDPAQHSAAIDSDIAKIVKVERAMGAMFVMMMRAMEHSMRAIIEHASDRRCDDHRQAMDLGRINDAVESARCDADDGGNEQGDEAVVGERLSLFFVHPPPTYEYERQKRHKDTCAIRHRMGCFRKEDEASLGVPVPGEHHDDREHRQAKYLEIPNELIAPSGAKRLMGHASLHW